MTRGACIALALALAACGKYGPPVRTAAEPVSARTSNSTAPANGNTEECPDPNQPPQPAPRTP